MPRTLLVVDDSSTICQAVRHALAGEDWVVVTASGEAEALDTLRARRPDVVLCDVSPGEADGYGVCRSLLEAAEGRGPAVVMMGAKVSDAAAGAAGAAAVLPKPFESAELLETVQAAVRPESEALDLGGFAAGDETLQLEAIEGSDLSDQGDGVEIIDLSGGDEFGELEVLEGLEPLEPARAVGSVGEEWTESEEAEAFDLGKPVHAEWAQTPETALEEAGEELLEFESAGGDLEAPFEPPRPAAPEPTPLESSDSAPEPEPTSEGFSFDPREFEERLDAAAPAIPEAETAGSRRWESESLGEWKTEEPVAAPEEPLPSGEAGLEVGESPAEAVTAEAEPDEERISAAAEDAVRRALGVGLSPERLAPLVEAVVERVVWEVVPALAERLIRETIEKLREEPPPP